MMDNNVKENRIPDFKLVLLVLLATLFLTFIFGAIGALLGAKTGLFLLEAIIIVPALFVTIQQRYSFVAVFRLRPVNLRTIQASILLGLGLTVVIDEFDRLFQLVLPMPEILRQAMEESLKIQTVSEFFIIVFSAVFLAAILEELLFRGFVQTSFEKTFDVTKAVMATAFLFAIIHLNPWWTVQFTLFGTILGVMAWKSNSVFPPMIVHFINNGTALAFSNTNPESIAWYLNGNHVNIFILLIAIFLTVFGMKLLYESNENQQSTAPK